MLYCSAVFTSEPEGIRFLRVRVRVHMLITDQDFRRPMSVGLSDSSHRRVTVSPPVAAPGCGQGSVG